ncbi:MAG: peptidase S41 [Cyclobacteriaceae bacterium]|nr:peptidase S41 [Cyclobacteriaceae bacterium]
MKNLVSTVLLAIAFINLSGQTSLPSFTEPALSPSGDEIAFVSGGDIWTVSSKGGEARLLVVSESFESRPLYSPDGKYIAFTSQRSGNGDVYIIRLDNGELKRLTFDDGLDEVSAWTPDSGWIFFSTTGKEISGMGDVFKVSILGGTPVLLLDEPYTNEFFANPSGDGNAIAFNARGVASRQWWRRGHSHLDESEIWIRKNNGELSKVTDRGAKSLWPMWSKDNSSIFYTSDRDGIENLWSQPLNGAAKKLTTFTNGRVLWPSMSYDGKTILFERDLTIWKYDIASTKAEPVTIIKKGSASAPLSIVSKLTNQFNEFALSPDGKKIAFIVKGEVFAVSAKDGGDAVRVTSSLQPEDDITWTGDSKSIIYSASTSSKRQLFSYSFDSRSVKQLTNSAYHNEFPFVSPDGKSLAYIRDGKELHVMDIASGTDKRLATAYFNRGAVASNSVVWSPDNKWIAFASSGVKSFRNISIVSAQGGEVRPVSFLSNSFGGNLIWAKEGKYLLYLSRQRTESGQVARIDLVPQTPLFAEERFQNLFSDPVVEPKVTPEAKPSVKKTDDAIAEKPKDKKSVTIVWEGIQQRISFLPIGLDANSITLSNDGKTLLVAAAVAGQENLYTWSLDPSAKEAPVAKQLTSTPGGKNSPVFSSDDKDVFYLEQGRIQKINIESRQAKGVDITAEVETNFLTQKSAMYQQAWEIQRDNFYDTAYHGRDWNAAGKKYAPYANGAGSPDELRRIIGLLLGELNASHSGVSAPNGSAITAAGRIGLRFESSAVEKGQLKIKSIIPLSPAAVSGNIKLGEYVVAVDDTLITSSVNYDKLLLNKIGKRVTLKISPTTSVKEARSVDLKPVNMATEKGLLYKEWVAQQRDYVHKKSNGRLGYVHMFDMSSESLNQLYFDLDAENHAREGVVVDVRNNNGGFVNAYALDVFSRKAYMTMTIRGLPSAPARTQLGQRSLELPTILLINQHSLSDAEDFTEGYKTLQLGKVVGEPTGGWIIYTSGTQLIDGSNLRLPFIRITDHEGKNMELAPRQPDIKVSRALGESGNKVDTQLDTAVKELLGDIDSNKKK